MPFFPPRFQHQTHGPAVPGERGHEDGLSNQKKTLTLALSRNTGRGNKKKTGLLCLLLMAMALIAYWPATRAEFVSWDDVSIVQENPALTHPSAKLFRERWTHPYLGMYMPVTQTFYQAAAAIGRTPLPSGKSELNPWVFHWGMVGIALLNIPLIFTFLRRVVRDDWAAAAGTGLMVLHPITTESFAWASGVSIPLCTTFLLAALLQWLNFRARGKRVYFVLAFIFYMLALLTKPICICMPFMAGALDICVLGISWKRSVRQLLPWIIPAVLLGWYMNHLQPTSHIPVYVPPLWQRPAVAVDAIVFYLGKILAPRQLGIDYGRTPDWVLQQHGTLLWEWAALLLLAVGVWGMRRRRPIMICAAIFFVSGLGAVLGLMPFWFQIFSTVADRYAYVPMLGAALAIAGLLAGVRGLWPWLIVGAAMVLGMVLTFRQAETWHDSAALYGQAIEVHPHSWMAWDNSAHMLIGQNRPVEGLNLARVAYALDSMRTDIYPNIGMALAMLGDPGQAVPYFRRAIYAERENAVIAMNLGAAYVELGQYDLGIKWLEYAQKIDPSSTKARWLLQGAIQLRNKILHRSHGPTTQP